MIRSPYCPDCPRAFRPIPGDGPCPCPILIIAERPGENENKQGRVLVGKTGKELDQTYLPLAGLSRRDIRACNAVRCYALNNRTPTDREVRSCANYFLPAEMEFTEPEIVILMGSIACSLIPTIKLDYDHGIPQRCTLYDRPCIVVPMYHPALGLHESKWMTQLLEDWTNLPNRLYQIDTPHPVYKPDYAIATGKEILALPLAETLAIDTESHGGQPFSIQVSPSPSVSRMVLASDSEGLVLLADRLRDRTAILHNAPHDLKEMAQMGIRVDSVRDTLQEAYHLGNLPQGLKPLVFRLFGFTMTSWEDVVRPYSIESLLCWLVEALDIAEQDLREPKIERLKTKTKITLQPAPVERFFRRLIQHTSPYSDYDPWLRLNEFWSDDANSQVISHLESRINRYPILGIGNAPLSRAVEYACGDADWTGQLAVELARRRNDPFWKIDDDDCDRR